MTSITAHQNGNFRSQYLDIINDLNGDENGRRAAWDEMTQGDCYYHGLPVAFSYLPQLMGPDTRKRLADAAATTYRILAKVIARYRLDPDYRREFRFDPRVEELVLAETDYDEPLPFARVDCMYDEEADTLAFCEFNTDASSGMYENSTSLAAIRGTEAFARFAAQHNVADDVEQHFGGWVATFLRLRAQALERRNEKPSHPHMAIAVCFDSPEPELGELREYCRRFEEAGVPCSVFDVREMTFDGHVMRGQRALVGESNVVVDSIWRYAIVVDLLQHWEDCQGFVEGARAGAAIMVGGFGTQIAHDKQLFAVLHRPATQEFLTPEERVFVRDSIPRTAFLDDPALDLDAVRAEPGRWVVKPVDWYASTNVTAGSDCTPEEWNARIDACLSCEGGSPWIVQEFHAPYRTPALPIYGDEGDFTGGPRDFGNIVGLYLFAGVFSGVYVRQGPHGVIGSAREGLVAPVLWVDCQSADRDAGRDEGVSRGANGAQASGAGGSGQGAGGSGQGARQEARAGNGNGAPMFSPCRTRELNDEYLGYLAASETGGDTSQRRACQEYMAGSTAVIKGKVVHSSYIPKIYDRVAWRALEHVADTTYRIIEKVMRRYLEDPDYRKVFHFDPRMEELIRLPRGYDALLPFARVDVFLDEETLEVKFCEFNADGSSGMNVNREITNSLRVTEPFRRFAAAHRVEDCCRATMEDWVQEFLRIYATYERNTGRRVERPHIAIVDYLESSILSEFEIFQGLFADAGYEMSAYDVRDLEFCDGHLIGRKAYIGRDNARIDAIWRRCVSGDVLAHWDESQGFIDAVRAGAVALIGSFAGHIVHDKQIFVALFDARTRAFLTQEECDFIDRTIPRTLPLTSTDIDLEAIKSRPQDWILKPTDGYGSRDVFPGPDYAGQPAEWERIVDAHADGASGVPFLVQRFCQPFKTPALPICEEPEDLTRPVELFGNLEGLYLINGKFAGVYSRLGPRPLIISSQGSVVAATVVVDR